ncbi:MAG: hypothetical protein AB7I30_24015, partial [Isosphaeraceae bacterium]
RTRRSAQSPPPWGRAWPSYTGGIAMVESPDHQRARLAEGPEPAPYSSPSRGEYRRRPTAAGPGCESLEGRHLLTATGWRAWAASSTAPVAVDWQGWSATTEPLGVSDQAVATVLHALDAGITAAQDEPNATTAERAAVRDGLLAVRALARQAADESPAASNSAASGPISVADHVARLKADVQALARGRTLPDATLSARIVARLDAVVQALQFTPDDLTVTRIAPVPASSGSTQPTPPSTPTSTPTPTHPVTVTPPSALPNGPSFPSWRIFAARLA